MFFFNIYWVVEKKAGFFFRYILKLFNMAGWWKVTIDGNIRSVILLDKYFFFSPLPKCSKLTLTIKTHVSENNLFLFSC